MWCVWFGEEIYKLMSKKFTFKIGPCWSFAVDNVSVPQQACLSTIPTHRKIDCTPYYLWACLTTEPDQHVLAQCINSVLTCTPYFTNLIIILVPQGGEMSDAIGGGMLQSNSQYDGGEYRSSRVIEERMQRDGRGDLGTVSVIIHCELPSECLLVHGILAMHSNSQLYCISHNK